MSRFGVKQSEGEAKKPLPYVSHFSEGFWDGLKNGQLMLQECESCGHKQLPPRAACEECASSKLAWSRSQGKGQVYSFTVIRQVVMNSPVFEAEIPYALSTIELDEGVRLVAQIQGCPPEQVKEGMRVEAYFEDIGGASVVKFKPQSAAIMSQ